MVPWLGRKRVTGVISRTIFWFLVLSLFFSITTTELSRLLSRDSCAEDLGSEETALCSLNDLLVYAAVGVVHDDGSLLEVDLCIEARVADEVNDPLLALVHVETELLAEPLEVDTSMDLAVRLEEEVAGRVDERVANRHEEEVGPQHLLGARKLPLRLLKVKVDVESANKIRHGVGVLVSLLLHYADNILQLLLVGSSVACAAATGDDNDGQVTQDPRARGLDSVDVVGREEHLEQGLARVLVVEQRKQGPVGEPCPVLELRQRVVEQPRVDILADLFELLHSTLPVSRQNLRCELAPRCRRNLVVVGREDTELVQKLSSCRIVAAAVLKVSKVVQCCDHLDGDLIRLCQQLSERI